MIYYYFRLVSTMLKMRDHGCLHYTLLRRIAFKAITFSASRATFIAIHICSGKIQFYDLQKFNLETCTEKPEVDIMMPLLVAKAQVIQ